MVSIVKENQIEFVIPMWEEILYLSKGLDRLQTMCEVFSTNFEALHNLHSKWLFMKKLEGYGFAIPETHLIKSQKDLQKLPKHKTFALKPCYSRAAQKVIKLAPSNPLPIITFEDHNPWIAQEWLTGQKFCSYSVCKNGKVTAHALYPVDYTVDQSSCLTFQAIEHPLIAKWVRDFVKKDHYTGQIAFDFFEREDGLLFAIECNPRATSGLYLFSKDERLDRAFLKDLHEPIFPKIGTKKQIVSGMVMYGWKHRPPTDSLIDFFKKLFVIKDVVFNAYDLKPFLSQILLMPLFVYDSLRLKVKIPAAYTHDLDWNGESL